MTSRITDAESFATVRQQMMHLTQYIRNQSDLEPGIRHLVDIRASQINDCAHCLAMHVEEALKDGDRVDRLALVSAWQEAEDWFTPRERAALLWTETLTRISTDKVSDELYAKVRGEFGEKDLADLTLAVIAINGWNRLNVPFNTSSRHFEMPAPETVAH